MIYMKHIVQMCLAVTVVSAIVALSGCASDKPKPAAAPPPPPPKPVTLGQIKSELLQTKTQIDTTSSALTTLHKSTPADAQANYKNFGDQYTKLQAMADAVRARAEDLKEKSAAYYAMWNKQVEVENPELRRQAVQQKADAERVFSSISSEMQLARIAFQPFMANLKDVGNYLNGNLTPANLSSISDLVTKSAGQAKEVNTHIDAIVSSIDKMVSATGEGATTKPAAQ